MQEKRGAMFLALKFPFGEVCVHKSKVSPERSFIVIPAAYLSLITLFFMAAKVNLRADLERWASLEFVCRNILNFRFVYL